MRRIVLYLTVALLTFSIGVDVAPLRFKETGIGCGRVIGGGGFSVRTYRSSHFRRLIYEHGRYSSPESANQELEKYLAVAVKVLERSPKLNKQGQPVGERVVGLFPTDSGYLLSAVFWTDEESLGSIQAFSLRHVLEFEQTYASP